jgi:hypothetical protein
VAVSSERGLVDRYLDPPVAVHFVDGDALRAKVMVTAVPTTLLLDGTGKVVASSIGVLSDAEVSRFEGEIEKSRGRSSH